MEIHSVEDYLDKLNPKVKALTKEIVYVIRSKYKLIIEGIHQSHLILKSINSGGIIKLKADDQTVHLYLHKINGYNSHSTLDEIHLTLNELNNINFPTIESLTEK